MTVNITGRDRLHTGSVGAARDGIRRRGDRRIDRSFIGAFPEPGAGWPCALSFKGMNETERADAPLRSAGRVRQSRMASTRKRERPGCHIDSPGARVTKARQPP